MDQVPVSPSVPENITPPPTLPPILPTHKVFPKKIAILGIIILILGGIILALNLNNKPINTTPITQTTEAKKTWELILNFNRQTNSYTVKNLTLLDKEVNQDYRSASNSPYRLIVSDKNNLPLYSTRVNITQELVFELANNPTTNFPPVNSQKLQPDTLDTTLYIPYFKEAHSIRIQNGETGLLQIELDEAPTETKKTSFLNLIPEVKAQENNSKAIQAVFISDGYTDFNQFHQDVEDFKNTLNAEEPYASANPKILSFSYIDNSQSLGCTNGILTCLTNPQIKQVGISKFPRASKFIVLVNDPNGRATTNSAIGAANGLGGDVGVFTNYKGFGITILHNVAIHEILGHMVGELHDRYVLKNPAPYLLNFPNRSNCTDNPNGEALWKQVGVTTGSKSCISINEYAPSPTTCNNATNPDLVSGGSTTTVMSAAGCGGSNFDAVEQNWIRTQIIPKYQDTTNNNSTPTPAPSVANTPAASSQPGAQPSGLPAVGPGNITGKVWNDTNRNKVQDNGESGIAGVTVSAFLYVPAGAVKTATTDSNGIYVLSGLGQQEYITILTLPNGYQPTTQAAIYAYTGPANPAIVDTNIASFGVVPASVIAGNVFIDTNRNGIKDNNEQNYNSPVSLCFDWISNNVVGNITSKSHCSGTSGDLTLGKMISPADNNSIWSIPTQTNNQGAYQLKGYSGLYALSLKELPLGYSSTSPKQQIADVNTRDAVVDFGIAVGNGTSTGPQGSSAPVVAASPSSSASPTSGSSYICEEVSEPNSSAGQAIQLKRLRCHFR